MILIWVIRLFGGINEASGNAVYSSTAGKKHKISNLNGTLFKNWTAHTLEINNLELNTVAAANAAIMAQTGKEVKAKKPEGFGCHFVSHK